MDQATVVQVDASSQKAHIFRKPAQAYLSTPFSVRLAEKLRHKLNSRNLKSQMAGLGLLVFTACRYFRASLLCLDYFDKQRSVYLFFDVESEARPALVIVES